jgi:hypothetical protein
VRIAAISVQSICLEDGRREIASCEEKAYDSLPLSDAMNLLFFTKQSDLMVFAQEVRRSASVLSC